MSIRVGQQLRQTREARSLSIERASQETHIRAHILRAMEAGAFETLPSQTQARGFLRVYADYLKIDAQALTDLLDEPHVLERPAETPPHPSDMVDSPLENVYTSREPEPPTLSESSQLQSAEEHFLAVGEMLRKQRSLLGLSMDDVVLHTHLRKYYLEALEAGDLNELPSPVQGRGMLKNYAEFLGMDADTVLLRFAEGLQTQLAIRQASQQSKPARPKLREPRLPLSVRRLVSGDVLIGLLIALGLVVFVTWGAIQVYAIRSEQQPTPTAPSIVDVLLASPTVTPPPTLAPASPTTLATLTLIPPPQTTGQPGGAPFSPEQEGMVQVYITIEQRAWMRVIVDGEQAFEGRVLPGSAFPFAGENTVDVLTGNGAAIHVIFNQFDLGTLGTFGQVVHRVFAREGILTPTPTVTITASPTPETTTSPVTGQSPPPALP